MPVKVATWALLPPVGSKARRIKGSSSSRSEIRLRPLGGRSPKWSSQVAYLGRRSITPQAFWLHLPERFGCAAVPRRSDTQELS